MQEKSELWKKKELWDKSHLNKSTFYFSSPIVIKVTDIVVSDPYIDSMLQHTTNQALLSSFGGFSQQISVYAVRLIVIKCSPPLQAIYYELGFIVLTVLGVIFVLFMPIVGMCLCVCRCCENCGGEMHQRQKKNGDCLRGFYMATLIATSVFLAWVFLIFKECLWPITVYTFHMLVKVNCYTRKTWESY